MGEKAADQPPFEIFRGEGSPTLAENGCTYIEGATPVISAGLAAMQGAGAENGAYIDVPYSRPHMSLARLRLKSGYPLPLHSHDCDCLYYVASGTIRMGTETLVAGDGFYVGTDVPYGYVAGPEGAVVLEFRVVDRFNTVMHARTGKSWENINGPIAEAQERWASEPLPEIA